MQKFGRSNEKTPAKWNASYKDFNRTDNDGSALPVAETTSNADVLAAPAIPPTGITAAEQAEAGASMDIDVKSSKKRKSRGDDDESPEDKAERKRKKKEDKAAKKAKKEKKSKGDDDSSSD
jgi:H/ACA ribonucleoprotein complex subunit 4